MYFINKYLKVAQQELRRFTCLSRMRTGLHRGTTHELYKTTSSGIPKREQELG